MADPAFGQPGKKDIFLGVDVSVDVLYQGQQNGPPDSPVTLEIKCGRALCDSTDQRISENQILLLSMLQYSQAPQVLGG